VIVELDVLLLHRPHVARGPFFDSPASRVSLAPSPTGRREIADGSLRLHGGPLPAVTAPGASAHYDRAAAAANSIRPLK
jgi:hypothetical protein